MDNEHRHALELRHARDDEQRRIAELLHTGVAQTLAGLRIRLDLYESQSQNESQAISALRPLLEQSLTELQELITSLRPSVPDNVGLPAALQALTSMVSVSSSKDIRLHIDEPFPALLLPLETVVYTVVRKMLLLLSPERKAASVEVVVSTTTDSVQLNIESPGDSLLSSSAEHDATLRELQEQVEDSGGTWKVRSANGMLTHVAATVPLLLRDAKETVG